MASTPWRRPSSKPPESRKNETVFDRWYAAGAVCPPGECHDDGSLLHDRLERCLWGVLDGHVVVSVAPDRSPLVVVTPIATNHQQTPEWSHWEQFSRSEEREKYLAWLLASPEMNGETLVNSFLQPPLYSLGYDRGFGTLYTARYEPEPRRATLLWPGQSWVRTFGEFDEDELLVEYPFSDF